MTGRFLKNLEFCLYFYFLLGCTDNIYTSDHSPVFSTFKIGKVDPNPTSIGKANKQLMDRLIISFSQKFEFL